MSHVHVHVVTHLNALRLNWRRGSIAHLAHPARLAVEGALYRGRYGINTDSHAAPQPDPRARREVSAHRARSREICFLPVGVDRENV